MGAMNCASVAKTKRRVFVRWRTFGPVESGRGERIVAATDPNYAYRE